MLSLTAALVRQNLIARKNDLEYQMLANSGAARNMLNNVYFGGDLALANAQETALALENIDNSVQLMAINAELDALNGAKLNYLA